MQKIVLLAKPNNKSRAARGGMLIVVCVGMFITHRTVKSPLTSDSISARASILELDVRRLSTTHIPLAGAAAGLAPGPAHQRADGR
jgi:hypothetical protein